MLAAWLAFLFGLLIGSFLNVCIYRLPRDLSVVRPRSYCPECKSGIAWYDNVPVVSYLLLRGRCRRCCAPIPFRYPLVEALTGLLFFGYVAEFGPHLAAWKFCVFAALLLGMVFTDLYERFLPESFTIGGLAAGLVFAWFVPLEPGPAGAVFWLAGVDLQGHWASVAESAAGALVPAFLLWAGGSAYLRLRKREGLGLGDVLMMAMIGAFLGLPGAFLTLIAGSVAGSIVGLGFILVTRKDWRTYYLPFGTFLGAAGILVSFLGSAVLNW